MSMQDIRNQRAYVTMERALSRIASARHDCATWNADDFERFARESMRLAREALETETGAAITRRGPRHSL